ncbi:MAG: cytochrome C [Bacteroidetes bacterium]|nr:cytochrome C [Bacteroidota bacterium]MCW5896978.1 cytochrome C [Bacteroidota bacterium]
MEHLLKIISKPDNLPIILMLVMTLFYAWLAWKKAATNDRQEISEEAKQADKVQVWPYLVKVEFLGALVVMVILTFWSFLLDAPLEEPANPALTPNPSKAPWYFLGLQEILVYFDPWIAGVLIPTFIIIGLAAIPYIDINPKGNGYYTYKERKFAILTFCFGFLLLWVALIVLGTFFRGPGWNLFWPWEYWDTHRVVALTNIDFTELFGIPTRLVDDSLNPAAMLFGSVVILGWYLIAVVYYLWKKNTAVIQKLGLVRYSITAFLFMTMMAVPVKIILRLTLNVKYILVTPFFNI